VSAAVRLRQGVLVAPEVEPLAGVLRSDLGLGDPFVDPGVAEFGLTNAVMALGDTFIEVIAPVEAGAPARRRLERHGPGGYMLIVQVDDVEAARRLAGDMGIRIVWQADLPDISGTHLHPADLGGTLLSIDEARPPQTWHWGGPEWTGRVPKTGPGRLVGATVATPKPVAVAARWAAVLGCATAADEPARVPVDGGYLQFVTPQQGGDDGIVAFEVAVAPATRAGREHLDVGGLRLTLTDA
jgi:hypothetical protein